MHRRSPRVPIALFFASVLAACSAGSSRTETTPTSEPPAPEVASAPRFPALFIDMDGTLLGDDHEPREATLAALADFQACGGRFGIATGRTAEQVRPYLDRLHPDLPFVLFNGAVIMDPTLERILFASAFPVDRVVPLLQRLAGDDRVMSVFLAFADRTWVYPGGDEVQALAERIHTTIDRVCESAEACRPPSGDDEGPLLKVLAFTVGDVAQALADDMATDLPEGVRAVVGYPSALEIIAGDVNKAAAIRRVLDEQGLTIDDVLVFGDSGNDVEMVREIPASVAMGNCNPRTCEAAMVRAGDNDTDTIARIIRAVAMGPGCAP